MDTGLTAGVRKRDGRLPIGRPAYLPISPKVISSQGWGLLPHDLISCIYRGGFEGVAFVPLHRPACRAHRRGPQAIGDESRRLVRPPWVNTFCSGAVFVLLVGDLFLIGMGCRRDSGLTRPDNDNTTAFQVQCDPSSLSVSRNGRGSTTCTVTSTGDFTGDVQLACTDLPAGITCELNPAMVTVPAGGSASSQLQVNVGRVNPGSYSFRVVGSFTSSGPVGSVEQRSSFSLQLTVPPPDFSVACSPSTLSVSRGGSVAALCSVNSTGGFDESVRWSCAGQPAGVTCDFNPTSVAPPPDGSVSSGLTIRVAANVSPGTYTFQVRGTAGSQTRSVDLQLTVTAPAGGDFSIVCSPASLTVPQDGEGTTTCTVTSVGDFSGRVRLSCVGQPARVDCQFDPNAIEPSPGNPAASTLTVKVDKDVSPGTYVFQVQGTSGNLTRSAPVQLTVVEGD